MRTAIIIAATVAAYLLLARLAGTFLSLNDRMNPEPKKTPAPPGTVIHGTMRTVDVIPALMETLEKHNPERARIILDKERGLADALTDLKAGETSPWWDSEEAVVILNEDLFEAMREIAPEGHWFGSHPGDGSDLGFWPDELAD